jgi:hypothetical protein
MKSLRLITPLRVTLLLAALAFALPIGHAIWVRHESARLEQALARLAAAGEPVTPADLHLDSLPADQNASLDYKSAMLSINGNSPAWKKWNDADDDQFLYPYTPAEQAEVKAIVAEDAAVLARVRAARGKPAGGWNDQFVPGTFPTDKEFPLNSERSLGNLLMVAAKAAHTDGDDRRAIELLTDGLAVANAGEMRPSLIAHLVALGMTAVPADAASVIAPGLKIGPGGASRQQVDDLIHSLLDEKPIDDGIKLSWRTERMNELALMNGVIDGTPQPGGRAGDQPEGGPAASGYLIEPLLISDEVMLVGHLQGMMAASTAPDWSTARRRMPTALPDAIKRHPYLHLLLNILIPSLDRAVMQDFHTRAQTRLAAVALACRLYEIDHDGNFPAALAGLVPQYLPAVPADPMSGNPLLYKTDNPRVYSVGDDGIDNGGIPADRHGKNGLPRGQGDIVVYLKLQPRKMPTTMP